MESPKAETIIEAFKRLIAVKHDLESGSKVIERLSSNLADTSCFLADNGLEKRVLAVKEEYKLLQTDSSLDDVQWNFIAEVLSLLPLLCSSLPPPPPEAQHTPLEDAAHVAAPPGLLSIRDEQAVRGALQFVSLLGIYPYLSEGVGVSLKARTKNEIYLAKSTLSLVSRNLHLCRCTEVLLYCVTHCTLAPFILSSVLHCDILASLIQIVYSNDLCSFPTTDMVNLSKGDDCTLSLNNHVHYRRQLFSFMSRIHPSVVVKDLLVLQGPPAKSLSKGLTQTPKWFSDACGQLLSGLLMEKNGLVNIIRGIFEDSEGISTASKVFWLKCQAVAKVVSSCPSQVQSVSSYYEFICPQILDLLDGDDKLLFVVASSILSAMISLHRDEAQLYLVSPLLEPFITLTLPGSPKTLPLSKLFVFMKTLNKILSVSGPGSSFYLVLVEFTPILFELWRSIAKYQPKLPESSIVKELLIKSLKSVDYNSQLLVFHHLLCIPSTNSSNLNFKNICKSLEVAIVNNDLMLKEKGEITEATYSHQVEDLGSSITGVLLDPEIAKGKLVGSVFLTIIDHLVSLLLSSSQINEAFEKPAGKKEISSVLLELEVGEQVHSFSSTLVLYVAAALCETVAERILTEVDNVSLVRSLTLIIKCHAATERKETIRFRRSDDTSLVGGHITLSIALGLLSAFMTSNNEIPVKLRSLLSSVLPELETLSQNCKSSELATLAEELRVCIATLGAVWSRETKVKCPEHENVAQSSGTITGSNATISDGHTSTQEEQVGTRVEQKPIPKGLEKVFNDLKDPLLPVQGHGLIELARLIERQDLVVIKNIDLVLATLCEHLEHNDSYIYMAAIRGIVAASSIDPSKVVTLLCKYYAGIQDKAIPSNDQGLYLGKVANSPMSALRPGNDSEKILKVGEALIKVVECLGNALSFHADRLISAFMINARHTDPLIRASALSNLAELCGWMKFTFTGVENEILSLLSNVLHFDSNGDAKRAAVTVIKNIFKSFMDQESCVQELQQYLLQLYRLIKHVDENECDPVTRACAQAALGDLDTIMRQYLFPPISMKITVLP